MIDDWHFHYFVAPGGVEKMKMPHGVGKKKKKEEKEGEERGLWRGGGAKYL